MENLEKLFLADTISGFKKMDTKKWYASKLVWLGVIQVAIGLLSYVHGNLETGATFSLFGVLTTLLRLVTTTGVTL